MNGLEPGMVLPTYPYHPIPLPLPTSYLATLKLQSLGLSHQLCIRVGVETKRITFVERVEVLTFPHGRMTSSGRRGFPLLKYDALMNDMTSVCCEPNV